MIKRAAHRAADRIIANHGQNARIWLLRAIADPRSKNIRFLEYVLGAYFPAPPEIPPPPPPKPSLAGIPARVSCVLLDTPRDLTLDRLAFAVAGRGTLVKYEIGPRKPDLARSAPVSTRLQAFKRCGPMGLDRRMRRLLGVASAANEIADLRPPPRVKRGESIGDAMRQKELEVALEAYEQGWNRRHS